MRQPNWLQGNESKALYYIFPPLLQVAQLGIIEFPCQFWEDIAQEHGIQPNGKFDNTGGSIAGGKLSHRRCSFPSSCTNTNYLATASASRK